MAEQPHDVITLQREIAQSRQNLLTNIERLRGTIHDRIELGRHIRDRVLTVALVGGVLLSLLFFGTRSRRRRKRFFDW